MNQEQLVAMGDTAVCRYADVFSNVAEVQTIHVVFLNGVIKVCDII